MGLTTDLTRLKINEIDRRIIEAEKTRGVVTLDAKTARDLLELAVRQMERENGGSGW